MLPTLNAAGDVVFVDKLTMRWRPLQRGELIVAKSPTHEHQRVCKRVIAVVCLLARAAAVPPHSLDMVLHLVVLYVVCDCRRVIRSHQASQTQEMSATGPTVCHAGTCGSRGTT